MGADDCMSGKNQTQAGHFYHMTLILWLSWFARISCLAGAYARAAQTTVMDGGGRGEICQSHCQTSSGPFSPRRSLVQYRIANLASCVKSGDGLPCTAHENLACETENCLRSKYDSAVLWLGFILADVHVLGLGWAELAPVDGAGSLLHISTGRVAPATQKQGHPRPARVAALCVARRPVLNSRRPCKYRISHRGT